MQPPVIVGSRLIPLQYRSDHQAPVYSMSRQQAQRQIGFGVFFKREIHDDHNRTAIAVSGYFLQRIRAD